MSVGGRRKQQKEGNDVAGVHRAPVWSLPKIVVVMGERGGCRDRVGGVGGGVSRKQQQKEGNDVAGVNCHRAPV
jgi:hypothetical protein